MANIGQVKNLFSFDPGRDGDQDGLPDWWESKWFGGTNAQAGAGDYDSDLLLNSNEYWYATSPTSWDTDGDGVGDGAEVALGTDPLNNSSYPVNVSGVLTYAGDKTGTLWVVAVANAGSWATNYSCTLTSPGAYSITNLPNLANYWIKAWRDSNGNKQPETTNEAWGVYLGNPGYISNTVSGVNITLADSAAGVTITLPANNSIWVGVP